MWCDDEDVNIKRATAAIGQRVSQTVTMETWLRVSFGVGRLIF